MSAKGLFIRGFTKAEVEAILARAKALLLEGKTVMSWSDSGTSASKQFVMAVEDVLEECAYALEYFDNESENEAAPTPSLSRVAWRLPF